MSVKYKLIDFFKFFSKKYFKKEIIFVSNQSPAMASDMTAVKSSFGFWYVGNIFNAADISYGILNNGMVEKEETLLVNKILNFLLTKQDGLIFYDVGANTGYYGLLAANMGRGYVKVHSFEPVKEHTDTLRESVVINNFESIVSVHETALGNINGQSDIYLSGSGSTIIKGFMNVSENDVRRIKINKLDDLCNAGEVEKPDFIKIDVEGAELDMLRGGVETIKKSRPIIFVEIISHSENGQKIYDNLQSQDTMNLLIKDLGYIMYCLDDNKLREVGEGWKMDGVKMYLCLDKNKHADLMKLLCL